MAQFARPDSDISDGLWVAVGGPTDLFDSLDEVTANDLTDYINAQQVNTTCEVGLSNVADPVSNTGHIMRFRIQGNGSFDSEDCKLELYDGATLIASTGNQNSRGAWATFTKTLTGTEADNIGDYTDLRFKIISSGLILGETMWCTWAEFEVPEAVGVQTGSLALMGVGV